MRIGYLSQDVAELDPTLRVLEAVEAVRRQTVLGDGRELTASRVVGAIRILRRAAVDSGRRSVRREKRRLQLLRLLMDEPNVLLLDEPTNDLDVDTLTALEDLLDSWAGTLIAASTTGTSLSECATRRPRWSEAESSHRCRAESTNT